MSEAHPKDQFEIHSAPELSEPESEDNKPNEDLKPDPNKEESLSIDQAREKVLEQPHAPLELPVDDTAEGAQPQYIDKAMKKISLKNELSAIREKLPQNQRLLSRLIHQPVIKTASQVGSKTVSRPSGLLGGGILAFCGSLIYLLLTKYVGIRYNYFVSTILFVSGFIVGILIELVGRLLANHQKKVDPT